MIRLNGKSPKALEFTVFEKNSSVSDEELITAAMQFEALYLKNCKGVIFHCLARNLKGQYANALFAENMDNLKEVEKGFSANTEAKKFMECINHQSVKVYYHHILTVNVMIPKTFGCIEHGCFTMKNEKAFSEKTLLEISEVVEADYLSSFTEHSGHFIGKIDNEVYSEISFGDTLGKTREICFGYENNPVCQQLLNHFKLETVNLDFWIVVA